MRKSNFIWKAVVAMVPAALFFTACVDDPETPALDATADVFIQQITENGESKTALAFWVFANQSIDTVTAEGPDAETWALKKEPTSSQIFSLFPEAEDYSSESPATGTYKFAVSGNQAGEAPLNITDELGSEVLGAMLIDTVGFENSKLTVKWEPLANVEAFLVRLYDGSDELMFVGPKLISTASEFSFGVADSGWSDKKAENGKTYRLEVLGIRYEAGSTAMNRDYNVQFISMTSTDVVWGE